MIIQKELMEKIKDFGLNSYEVKIWTALLSRGVSTAGELSDIANVPRSRSYDVLESLEKKGFVIMKLGKPIKYIAVPPREVIERVKKRIHEEAVFKENILAEMETSEVLQELVLLHSQGIEMIEPTDLSGYIKGRDNIYNHLESMINQANDSILLMSTEKGLIRKLPQLKKVLKKANKRGVTIKIVGPISEETKKIVEDLEGVELQNIDKVKARFIAIDNKEMAFMVLDDEEVHPSYDVGVWVNTPFFTKAFVSMFEGSNN